MSAAESIVHELMGVDKEFVPRIIPLELAAKIFNAPAWMSTKEVAEYAGCTCDDVMMAYHKPIYYWPLIGHDPAIRARAMQGSKCRTKKRESKYTAEEIASMVALGREIGAPRASIKLGIPKSTIAYFAKMEAENG